jgi:hypothetical protein
MKQYLLVALMAISMGLTVGSTNYAVAFSQNFPENPHEELTPGSLCEHPDEYRYRERIPYCSRDVSKSLKQSIIAEYDRKLGYRVGQMQRNDFKIHHYIPLCAGGSNERDNLWPQHKTVYSLTDPVEQKICEKMVEGKILQNRAVELIRRMKLDLEEVDPVNDIISRL